MQGLKIAVVVNDVAKVNIDSKLVRERTAGTAGDENMADCVELQNGCACCNASDELLQVRALFSGVRSASSYNATVLLTQLHEVHSLVCPGTIISIVVVVE